MEATPRYVSVDGTDVAYLEFEGRGDLDLLVMFFAVLPISPLYDDPVAARVLDGLRELGRVVVFDRRGVGLSGPIVDWDESVDQRWVNDLMAVADATEMHTPILVSLGANSGPVAALAATQMPQTSGLVLFEPMVPAQFGEGWAANFEKGLAENVTGEGDSFAELFPGRSADRDFREWWIRAGNAGAGPTDVRRLLRARDDDELQCLHQAYRDIAVPALLIRRPGSWRHLGLRLSESADATISVTQRVEVPGEDMMIVGTEVDAVLAEISDFLVGEIRLPPAERVVQAVLFTDLVSSTELASDLGDSSWRSLIEGHDQTIEKLVARDGGRLVKSTGDGVLAVLPSATAAFHAAVAVRDALGERELEVRAGVHVGDLDRRGDDVAGLTVNIAARVMAQAGPGEILATESTARVAIGSDLKFISHSTQELRGVPGEWEIVRLG